MGDLNQNPFNTDPFGGGGYDPPPVIGPNPGSGPYNYPQITINAPLAPPPLQLTNVPTLIDGQANTVGIMLFLNGLLQTETVDYTRTGGYVVMTVAPSPGDILTARVFAIGLQLGGSNPMKYIAPWTLRLSGTYDTINTAFRIAWGPTITPASQPGVYTWGVPFRRAQIFRNGLIQTVGVDVASGPTALVFLNGFVPDPTDIITVLGYV